MPPGVDEERADRVAARRAGHVVGVGDEEAVARRRGELLGHTRVVERDVAELLGAVVLEPQHEAVARTQLEVVHGLGADENRIGTRAQCRDELSRGPAVEVGVLQLGGRDDARGAHAVEVLEVGADVREAMLDRLDVRDPRDLGQPGRMAGPHLRPGDSVTVTSAPLVRRASTSAC